MQLDRLQRAPSKSISVERFACVDCTRNLTVSRNHAAQCFPSTAPHGACVECYGYRIELDVPRSGTGDSKSDELSDFRWRRHPRRGATMNYIAADLGILSRSRPITALPIAPAVERRSGIRYETEGAQGRYSKAPATKKSSSPPNERHGPHLSHHGYARRPFEIGVLRWLDKRYKTEFVNRCDREMASARS